LSIECNWKHKGGSLDPDLGRPGKRKAIVRQVPNSLLFSFHTMKKVCQVKETIGSDSKV
jgi:hypothetical protein